MLSEGRSALVAELLAHLERARPAPLAVLDLDGTLLDNRPRMRRILIECAARWATAGVRAVESLSQLEEAGIAYRVEDTLATVGVTDPALVSEAIAFWRDRFFTDEYLPLDRPTPGAAPFVARLLATGARVVYLTGRDVVHMGKGTLVSLREHGFPVLTPRASLCMKPDPSLRDLDFKLAALPELEAQGKILVFLDNDPRQCDAFARRFPGPDRFTILFGSNRAPEAWPTLPSVRYLPSF